jgi:hypothetical protein
MECLAPADHVGTVDIVSNLFRVIAEDLVRGTDITRMTYSWAKCMTCSPRSCRGSARRIRAASWEGSALVGPKQTINVLF